ncbi:hypothetical protein B484DRAFT_452501, partial [Ochromonadaceae sp. CCMP2298]
MSMCGESKEVLVELKLVGEDQRCKLVHPDGTVCQRLYSQHPSSAVTNTELRRELAVALTPVNGALNELLLVLKGDSLQTQTGGVSDDLMTSFRAQLAPIRAALDVVLAEQAQSVWGTCGGYGLSGRQDPEQAADRYATIAQARKSLEAVTAHRSHRSHTRIGKSDIQENGCFL